MRRVPWFIAGFIAAVVLFHGARQYADMPHDWTTQLPADVKNSFEEAGIGFLKNAYHVQFENLDFYRPASPGDVIAFATIGPRDKMGVMIFYDKNHDGVPDNIMIADKMWHHVDMDDEDNDGTWERWTYSLRPKNGLHYTDTDIDGQPDIAMNLDTNDVSVFVENSWHNLIKKDGRKYIQIGKELRELAYEEGRWSIIAPNPYKAL